MSEDRFDVLERLAPLFEAPEPSFVGFLRRRDCKRRNQRITASAVGLAFFVAAVWIVTTGRPFERDQTPAAPGGVTGATRPTGPTDVPPVGSVGLPPEGATPSTPERGKLVLRSVFGHTAGDPGRVELYLYEDGRLIRRQLAGGGIQDTIGFLEQRLTPEGVELVRSEVLSTGLFDRDRRLTPGPFFGRIEVRVGDRLVRVAWGDIESPEDALPTIATQEQRSALERLDARLQDPASWLPASAWEDPEPRPYVPSRFSVCYEGDPAIGLPRLLAQLPPRAEDLLRTKDRTKDEYGPFFPGTTSVTYWCSNLTPEEADALAMVLGRAGAEWIGGLPGAPTYSFDPPGRPVTTIHVDIGPFLPHE